MGFGLSSKKKERVDSTDDESGVYDLTDLLRGAEIHTSSRLFKDDGMATSFLLIESPLSFDDDTTVGYSAQRNDSWKEDWVSRPYKRERLSEEIFEANRRGVSGHATILRTLKNLGVSTFVIDSKVSTTTSNVIDGVRNVLNHIRCDDHCLNLPPEEKCLLYRDNEGRFFNLTFADHSAGLASKWESNLESFSCVQAITVLMVLLRSFPCIAEGEDGTVDFKPIILAAFLGMILVEEISHCWTNVTMLVRGLPSLSAYSLVSGVYSDWPRKIVLFLFLLGGSADGTTGYYFTTIGISLTCVVLLANLGSRAWGFLQWDPIANAGLFEPAIAFVLAVLTGVLFPFLAQRQVDSGGNPALESVFSVAVAAALLFVLSDYDDIQKYLIVGSEPCNQDSVNLAVGIWWTVATGGSLYHAFCKERKCIWPPDDEFLLEKDHASPVGFKVPNLPDFCIDKLHGTKGLESMSSRTEMIVGGTLTVCIGAFICFLSFTNYDDTLDERVHENIFS
eukprot:Nitzschia sp. Nitz4//scaffold141_size107518//15634//17223//NITZ4_004265-RA/size107518-augustus-gene-0.89-mRNA-1//-1//CDS//3329536255//4703//frame0